jgi:tyrosyl-tRNA synthetase
VKANEIIADLRRQEVEILTEQRLREVIERNARATTYIGFEPSSSLHLGNLYGAIPVIKLARAGFRAIILLADLHALANDKGELTQIQEFAKTDRSMFERIASKMGLGGKFEFRLGTEFQNQEYFIQLLRLARLVNFTEAEKSMDEVSKSSVVKMMSSAIYPLMQALDIGFLGVNVAVGGMDQRKIHVLAIENLKKLGYPTPVAIHTQIILGTDGKRKMSKSFQNTIELDESEESLETKIRKTYCAPGDVETNPILDWYEKMIFPLTDSSIVVGEREVKNAQELKTLWLKREISPQELKKAAVRDIGNIIL